MTLFCLSPISFFHVPKLTNGQVKVSIKGESDTEYQPIGTVSLSKPVNNDGVNDNFNSYLEDRFRIGFGTQGFETFQIDDNHSETLKNLRGKAATLKFEVTDGTVFLDDVFFQSEHLKFGLPTYNNQQALPLTSQTENYLIEKPQYALSYNNNTKNPNWVSWQLNASWLGTASRTGTWNQDRTLPSAFEPLVTGQDYLGNEKIDRGHMTASENRNRNVKDILATFITTNALPQATANNNIFSTWRSLEDFSRDLAVQEGKELYITAGGYGTSNHDKIPGQISSKNINVPSFTWKNILVLDVPRLALEDIDTIDVFAPETKLFEEKIDPKAVNGTTVISVITPNIPEPGTVGTKNFPFPHPLNEILPEERHRPDFQNSSEWQNWRNWTVLTEDIENLTNVDLLPRLTVPKIDSIEQI